MSFTKCLTCLSNKENKTYTSEETLGDVVAVRSYKDSDKYEINYTFLNKIAK